MPIADIAKDILNSVERGRVTIVTADTGSGKTLYTNSLFADYLDDQVVVLMPRRALAINAAQTVAKLSDINLGEDVGYAVGTRGGEFSLRSKDTRLLFATYGYALSSNLIAKANNIVLDEIHESETDIFLARAILHARAQKEEDLNIVEMSATIDAEQQAEYWQDIINTDTYHADGKIFDCEHRHINPEQKTLEETAIHLITEDKRQGISIFRPGKNEIEETAQKIREKAETLQLDLEISTIYGEKNGYARSDALREPKTGIPKIIIGTNVIETGVNIPWLDAGISDGTGKVPVYTDSGSKALEIQELPQWRLKQQAGRVNRFQSGIFVLHSNKVFDERPLVSPKEIRGAELLHFAWKAASLDYNPERLKYSTVISHDELQKAKNELQRYGLINDDWRLTPAGKFASHIPTDPSIAAMLWEAKNNNILESGIQLAALMSIGNIRTDRNKPHYEISNDDSMYIPRSDILDGLRAYQEYRAGLINEPLLFNIDPDRLRDLEESIQSIADRCLSQDLKQSSPAETTELRQLLLFAKQNSLFEQADDITVKRQIRSNGFLGKGTTKSVKSQVSGYRNALTGIEANSIKSPTLKGKKVRFVIGDIWQPAEDKKIIENATHITTTDLLIFFRRHPEAIKNKRFSTADNGQNYILFSYYGDNEIKLPVPEEISVEMQPLLGEEYVDFLKQKAQIYYANIATSLGIETQRIVDASEVDQDMQTLLDRTINADLYDTTLPVSITLENRLDDYQETIKRFYLGNDIVCLVKDSELSSEELKILEKQFPKLFLQPEAIALHKIENRTPQEVNFLFIIQGNNSQQEEAILVSCIEDKSESTALQKTTSINNDEASLEPELIEITDEIRTELRGLRKKTAVGLTILFKGRADLPDGLTKAKAKGIINDFDEARKDHVEYLLDLYRNEDKYIPLTSTVLAKIEQLKNKTGIGFKSALNNPEFSTLKQPDDIDLNTVENWTNGRAKRAKTSHIKYIIGHYEQMIEHGHYKVRITQDIISEIEKLDLLVPKISIIKEKDCPADLKTSDITAWTSGSTKTAWKKHLNFLMPRWRFLAENNRPKNLNPVRRARNWSFG